MLSPKSKVRAEAIEIPEWLRDEPGVHELWKGAAPQVVGDEIRVQCPACGVAFQGRRSRRLCREIESHWSWAREAVKRGVWTKVTCGQRPRPLLVSAPDAVLAVPQWKGTPAELPDEDKQLVRPLPSLPVIDRQAEAGLPPAKELPRGMDVGDPTKHSPCAVQDMPDYNDQL